MSGEADDATAINGHLHAAARKILFSRQAFRTVLPAGFVFDPTLELLLLLYVADGAEISCDEMDRQLGFTGSSARWLKLLDHHLLVGGTPPMARLTRHGRLTIEEGLETILDAQMKVKA